MDESVTIPRERYDELLDIETRVDVIVDTIASDDYVSIGSILRILGTKRAIFTANKIKEKMKDFSFGGILDESNN